VFACGFTAKFLRFTGKRNPLRAAARRDNADERRPFRSVKYFRRFPEQRALEHHAIASIA